MNRDGLVAPAHLQRTAVVGDEQAKLGQQVIVEKVGSCEGGFVATGFGHKTKAQPGGDLRGSAGLDANKRVKGAHPFREGVACCEAAHAIAQVVD